MHTPQKETPTCGGNHVAGVNTRNTRAIISDCTAPSNESTEERLARLAYGNRARLLGKAAIFASMHTKSTLWARQMKCGTQKLSVRMEWPGVLCVYDPATGEKLAESKPGQPDTLQK